QYYKYMKNLAHGDLGISVRHVDFDASEFIWRKMWTSAQIGIVALVLTFALGIPIGIYAAMGRGTFLDPLTIGFWLLVAAIPEFVAIPILQYLFAEKWGIVGVSCQGVFRAQPFPYDPKIILPILIIALPGIAWV